MRELLIASRSRGKYPETLHALEGLQIDIIPLNNVKPLPIDFDVEEAAMTFEGNAIIKAMIFGNKTGLLTLADDTGLEVDALGGKPGVYTKRYAPGTDEDRNRKLLTELQGVEKERRTARFRCVVAIFDPVRGKVKTCAGIYEGLIADRPKGSAGFGYDPVFIDKELNKTLAEITLEEKTAKSHRGKALRQARSILQKQFII